MPCKIAKLVPISNVIVKKKLENEPVQRFFKIFAEDVPEAMQVYLSELQLVVTAKYFFQKSRNPFFLKE